MSDPQNVQVLHDAEMYARNQFGLNTKAEIRSFIGNQGLQNITYVNTELWRYKPGRIKGDIYIDAYTFTTNQKTGYIAFMKGYDCKYVIKSFHLDYDKVTTYALGTDATKLLKEEI